MENYNTFYWISATGSAYLGVPQWQFGPSTGTTSCHSRETVLEVIQNHSSSQSREIDDSNEILFAALGSLLLDFLMMSKGRGKLVSRKSMMEIHDEEQAISSTSHTPFETETKPFFKKGTTAKAEKPLESDYREEYWLPQPIYDWLFPPSVPRNCQLFRIENLALPACYLMVGMLQGIAGPLCNVYPLDLGATEAQQTTVTSIRLLPASFKLIFGFISDNVPLGGFRRKSYMLLGWLVSSFSLIFLMLSSNLTLSQRDDDDGASMPHVPPDAPSIPFLSLCILGFGIGMWWADVMADAVVAEKAKLERERGNIQSTCYACRFFGLLISSPFATGVYSWYGPQYVVGSLAVMPLCILPIVYCLKEDRYDPTKVKSTPAQCQEIWNTVCSRAVWQPMGFKFVYNVLHVGNAAWKQYLRTVLRFSSSDLNSILVVAHALLYAGVLMYKRFFITWSWRYVYFMTTTLCAIFSVLQILLIKGITFGISNYAFALGDEALADFVIGIQFLPTTIMMVHLCPDGSEGASYAMFTTVSNSANTVHRAFSTMMLRIWDVSEGALERGEISGMVNLTLLTSAMQVSGVLFLGLLPRNKEDLAKLRQESSNSWIGGAIFLMITFSSLLYGSVIGYLNIVYPGWMGES